MLGNKGLNRRENEHLSGKKTVSQKISVFFLSRLKLCEAESNSRSLFHFFFFYFSYNNRCLWLGLVTIHL